MKCTDFWNCVVVPLQFAPTQRALLAAILIGILCSVVGAFVVLQDLSFIGDALAHASFPGVVIASMLGWNIALGGAIFGVATALGVGWITRRSKVSLDTAIGVLFAGMFALGIFLLSRDRGYNKELFGLLLGDILAVRQSDLWTIVGVGGLILVVIAALYKELVLMTFDRTAAAAQGLPVGFLHYLLLSIMAITVVVAIQSIGIVLVVAMLVTPAATASLVVRRFWSMIVWGSVQGLIAATIGIYVSAYIDGVPTGSSIVLAHTAIFLLVLVLAPRKNALAGLFQRKVAD
ncbi:MAG TPA: metal ABC transporter permease [Herpetosiphon sp.]|uniref:ABC-3 protein n=1 Tax=Herpetosiphon aurantiacus (strain ATCC 23779 / DSM 785 / 114-95) TaxID=316274 RepID=A9B4V9_HERA2|nr:metal ABC transporter permease [Herpetosiphon sp.]ABX05682.1 ABC-3 protein [Herpetosiphon aurantiacus DSM 785]MCA0354529.1 metal ABC transporter permease [Chloroflexota bacterium]HBW53086.1 metal ABC transporter permease [Herpetosiphon sp.]